MGKLYIQKEQKRFCGCAIKWGNKMNADTIDILLPTYNGEKYLKEQIDSILNQTYKNIRLII